MSLRVIIGLIIPMVICGISVLTAAGHAADWAKYSIRSMEGIERLTEAMKGVNSIRVFVSVNVSPDKTLRNLATQKKELELMLADRVRLWLSTWFERSTNIRIKKDEGTDASEATFVILVFIGPGLDGKTHTLNSTATLWRKVVIFPPVTGSMPFEVPVWESVQSELIPHQDLESLKRRLEDITMSLLKDFVNELPKTYKSRQAGPAMEAPR